MKNTKTIKKIILSILCAILMVFAFYAIAYAANDRSLSATLNQEGLSDVWKIVLSFVNYAVVVFLVFIAFANILNIQIDIYSVRKALPMLILGVILANLSWFICLMFVDLAEVIMSWATELAGGGKDNLLLKVWLIMAQKIYQFGTLQEFVSGWITYVAGGLSIMALLIPVIMLMLILLIAFVLVGLVMWARGYIIILLVFVSPLAFLCISLPMTQKLFQQWWSQFLKWIFVGPIIWILFVLVIKMDAALFDPQAQGMVFGKYVLVITSLYIAIKVPFSMTDMGSVLMGALHSGAKYVGKAGEKTVFRDILKTKTPSVMLEGFLKRRDIQEERKRSSELATGENLRTGYTALTGAFWKGKGIDSFRIAGEAIKESPHAITARITSDRKMLEERIRPGTSVEEHLKSINDPDEGLLARQKEIEDKKGPQPIDQRMMQELKMHMIGAEKAGVVPEKAIEFLQEKKRYKNEKEYKQGQHFIKDLAQRNWNNRENAIGLGYMPTDSMSALKTYEKISDPAAKKSARLEEYYNRGNRDFSYLAGNTKELTKLVPLFKRFLDEIKNLKDGPNDDGFFKTKSGGTVHVGRLAALADHLKNLSNTNPEGFKTSGGSAVLSILNSNSKIHAPKIDIPLDRPAPLHRIKDKHIFGENGLFPSTIDDKDAIEKTIKLSGIGFSERELNFRTPDQTKWLKGMKEHDAKYTDHMKRMLTKIKSQAKSIGLAKPSIMAKKLEGIKDYNGISKMLEGFKPHSKVFQDLEKKEKELYSMAAGLDEANQMYKNYKRGQKAYNDTSDRLKRKGLAGRKPPFA